MLTALYILNTSLATVDKKGIPIFFKKYDMHNSNKCDERIKEANVHRGSVSKTNLVSSRLIDSYMKEISFMIINSFICVIVDILFLFR